jgi:hypothetical protein
VSYRDKTFNPVLQGSRLQQPTELATPSRQVSKVPVLHMLPNATYGLQPASHSLSWFGRRDGVMQTSGSVHGGPPATPCTPRLEGLESVSDFFQVCSIFVLKVSSVTCCYVTASICCACT